MLIRKLPVNSWCGETVSRKKWWEWFPQSVRWRTRCGQNTCHVFWPLRVGHSFFRLFKLKRKRTLRHKQSSNRRLRGHIMIKSYESWSLDGIMSVWWSIQVWRCPIYSVQFYRPFMNLQGFQRTVVIVVKVNMFINFYMQLQYWKQTIRTWFFFSEEMLHIREIT